jgi:hypothetical protein
LVGRQRLAYVPFVDIRECRAEDLNLLEEWMPSGLTRIHAQRFGRQRQGLSTFLVAWQEASPVGSGEIGWDGRTAAAVRRSFPHCPALNGLQVWPRRLQSHGIGTAVITEAESLARQRGCEQTDPARFPIKRL